MRPALLILLGFFVCCSFPVSAWQPKKITITGKITDGTGNPVPGATIFIDKVKTNVVTGQDGSYPVKTRPGAGEILVFSIVKGAKKELIEGRTNIDFVLDEKSNTTENNKNASDDSKGLNIKDSSVPVYQDIYDMIRGRVPGVEVSGKSIRIRGVNSLNVSTEPLFVVDGVITGDIEGIAPETVSSIEVLKGPDASVYGARGSNGVIVIKRRTGKE